MKQVTLLIILSIQISFQIKSSAQCIADAGADTIVCLDFNYEPITIGGHPSASGGSGVYRYEWKTLTPYGFFQNITASEILDDTTESNPKIINLVTSEYLHFILNVTDSKGHFCTDTVMVVIDGWLSDLGDDRVYIMEGDTVQLSSGIGSSFPPFSYHWEPDYNLSNQNIETPFAWPDTSIAYTCVVTDSLGCAVEDQDHFEVFVTPIGIHTITYLKQNIFINPNLVSDQAILRFDNPNFLECQMIIVNDLGTIINQSKIWQNFFEIGKLPMQPGIFFCFISQNRKPVSSIKFVKE
ncbi:MAG: hypothetical protein H0W62_11340 [Chitinophagales bacterium]|nr:hypothetical protein [Chitinophagales bacterium]